MPHAPPQLRLDNNRPLRYHRGGNYRMNRSVQPGIGMFQPIPPDAVDLDWDLAPDVRSVLVGPNGLKLPDWIANGQARIIKHGPHRTVYQVNLPNLRFYLKHNRVHNLRAWLRGWL